MPAAAEHYMMLIWILTVEKSLVCLAPTARKEYAYENSRWVDPAHNGRRIREWQTGRPGNQSRRFLYAGSARDGILDEGIGCGGIFQRFYEDFNMEKARNMLEFMNLKTHDRISSLSKGMNERLQLSLALSREARLYMLDEPIGGVDPVARGKILDAIVEFYNEDSKDYHFNPFGPGY